MTMPRYKISGKNKVRRMGVLILLMSTANSGSVEVCATGGKGSKNWVVIKCFE